MITAPPKVEDGGHFSADSINSDDEQLDDAPFLSHQLPDDHESFSEKFLRNILTHDYQNLMPRRREKFVEITKTVTVTEIVNGAPDKHPSSCEVKVTNVSPAGPHPVNVSIKHLHEKWHSCEELERSDLGKGTVIHIHETHKPFNYQKKGVYEDVVNTKVETEVRPRRTSSSDRHRNTNMSTTAQSQSTLFNRSSDNMIDLEFRHPILVETSGENQKTSTMNGSNGTNGTRRRFADLRKRVSTTTKTSMTETEKVTTTRRSSSAHSTSSKRSYGKPEVHTLYYRKFVDEETKPGDQEDSGSDSGSVIIHRESATRRSQSADPLKSTSPISPVPPPRKRLGREESLHYYRDDEEVERERVKSPEPGNTSVSMNDTLERRNITAGITSISMNNSCTDTSFESRFSTIPRARSSPPSQRVNHIQVNVIGPIRTPEEERRRIPVGGRVGEDVTMDIHIEHSHGRRPSAGVRRVSASMESPAPPKPPRRSKWEDHHHIGEPIATSTPMTTIERKQTREERISVEGSGDSSRKSTRSARPPDINIIECESFAFSRSPARTPATPIVVINQTPNSRRSSQDLLGEPGQRRRKSTVTDIDWYAAFNMKDPSSPTKIARPPFGGHDDVRKHSKDIRRRASDSSMIGLPPADIDLNQIFTCTSPQIKKDEKCQCNACRLIRMSQAERELSRQSRTRQSRSYTRTSEFETRSSTLPSRHRTAPVQIELEDIFNPKPSSSAATSKPPTPPSRRRVPPPTFTAPPPPPESSLDDESPSRSFRTIDRSQVTTTNSRDSQLLHDSRTQLLHSTPSTEDVDWVGNMMNDANEWEQRRPASSRRTSNASTTSGTGVRKTSVARRISVDELKKPEKRKSREAVPLPPSDVSIDDIFTALTQKTPTTQESSKDERKTFIITRKQRAQDIDAIDFEKDVQEPVAPPRSKKIEDGTSEVPATSTVHFTLTPSASESSTAVINLDDVFTGKRVNDRESDKAEDEKIRKRVAEFSKSQQEKEVNRIGDGTSVSSSNIRRTSLEDSNISMDDVFNSRSIEVVLPVENESVNDGKNAEVITSTVSIRFNKEGANKDVNDRQKDFEKDEDIEIEKRISEFNRSEEEKSRQVQMDNEIHAPREKIFADSSISVDEIFGGKQTSKSEVHPTDVEGVADEERRIEKRVAEFERSKEEKEMHRVEEEKEHHHTAQKIFPNSEISMDDVFSPPTPQNSNSSITMTTELKESSSANISLEKVFDTRDLKKQVPEGEAEEKEIKKHIDEFNRNEEDKATQLEMKEETHIKHEKIFEDSNISVDDIFAGAKLSTSDIKPMEAKDVAREEERIEKRVAEFEKSKEEQEIHRVEEEKESHHTTRKIFEDSNISMDDVFNVSTNSITVGSQEKEDDQPVPQVRSRTVFSNSEDSSKSVFDKPTGAITTDEETETSKTTRTEVTTEKETRTVRITPTEVASCSWMESQETEATDQGINMDEIFVTGSSSNKNFEDEENKKIRRRIAEFERSKQEKEDQKTVVVTESKSSRILDQSNISMDDVFHPAITQPNTDFLSSVEISLDNVFATDHLKKPEDSEKVEDIEIEKRISEFNRNEEEKTRQVQMNNEIHAPREKIFADSSISVDEIFGGKTMSTSDVRLTDPGGIVEEEQRIDRRLAEFEKSRKEQEIHRVEEEKEYHQHATKKIFEDSDISMDDVFSTPTPQNSSSSLSMRPRQSSANISLEKVFDTGDLKKPVREYEKEEKEMEQRISEFRRNEAEKERQKEMNKKVHVTHEKIFVDSNISVDDIFGEKRLSPSEVKPVESQSIAMEEQQIEKRVTEFKKSQEEQETHRVEEEKEYHHHTTQKIFPNSDISMDDVFSPPTPQNSNSSITMTTELKESSSANISLEKVFDTRDLKKQVPEGEAEEKEIKKHIDEFNRNKEDKARQLEMKEETHIKHEKIFEDSNISVDDIFAGANLSTSDIKPMEAKDVAREEERIEKRVAEFEKSKEEQEIHRVEEEKKSHHTTRKIFEDSNISMDDVFNAEGSSRLQESTKASVNMILSDEAAKSGVTSSTNLNLDDIFVSGKSLDTGENEVDRKIKQRIAEFKKSQEEKSQSQHQETSQPSRSHVFGDSNISLEEIFNSTRPVKTSTAPTKTDSLPAKTKQGIKVQEHPASEKTFSKSNVSLEDVFPSTMIKTSSETETTRTTTTTTTETTSESYSKRSHPSLDDLFGPQTPTAIPKLAISEDTDVVPPTAPLRPSKNLVHLQVPGKFNESMMSTTSTISLDDSFNNSFAVSQPKMRKELTLPVDNWIDSLVAKATDEATKEAPKTPKTPKHFPSPTRISQEIKYEWVADLVGVQEEDSKLEDVKSEEQHLQKQDNTWVSSVVYRPTLETSAYTLRASQPETELDMDRVFSECLMGKRKEDEECECSACRLTEKELEQMRKRQIETKILKQEERESEEPAVRRNVAILSPSEFSIDDIFHVPLHIQTEPIQIPSTSSGGQMPSTSSPPLQSTRTYYLSPKVSETVTTTHQWKDNDISMDEIFSPVSVASTGNDNRRFSNFYEDRSGWDTMGSEDSGVMSGGGRRRSSRVMDQVIDEAFKGIFEAPTQPSTSKKTTFRSEKRDSTQYDDYYITSLNQAEGESGDSEMDGENLDVTQFVDDILGKSMDEAAFLSSTKSLRDHTDTSIDRKKSNDKMHPYYRTRTDTSIDRRSTQKPDAISEEAVDTQETHQEGHDEIMKLVFVDHSSLPSSASRGSLGRSQSRSRSKPDDEELLEIEIRPEYFLIRGSYSLLIPKSDPLGQMLQKLRDQNESLATLDFSLTRKLKKLLVSCIREKATGQMASSKYDGLSSRGQSLIESVDHASTTFLKMNVNKYLPETNPHGIVNFCTAENNICTPLLEERFKHLELFFPNTEHLARYPPSGGWPEAREVLVKYFREFMGAKVNTDEMVLTASTRTGYDVVSYCLFEQDDILLTNGPVYTGTISNVNERAQCVVQCVETDLSNPRLEVKKYEEALEAQLCQDNTVAGVIIVNPHNPLGVVFPPEDVVNLCNWAASKNLHVVIDEVFANCVFDKSNSKFRPFLSYRHRVHRPENVAWLWSVSKDFGLPGLKYAVIHSANEGLRKAALKLQLYHPCSPFVQDFAVKLLSDSEWLREFHTEVTKRMSIHYRYTAENLRRLEIPFVPAQAGIFVFADFSKYCTTKDTIGELDLFERLASAGVMLTPGTHQKCHVAGWFRLVFACSKQELEEGFRRLYSYLGSHLQPVGTLNYF